MKSVIPAVLIIFILTCFSLNTATCQSIIGNPASISSYGIVSVNANKTYYLNDTAILISYESRGRSNLKHQSEDSENEFIPKPALTEPQSGDTSVIQVVPTILTLPKGEIKNNKMAILFSGDGGWFGFEHNLSERLASYGIPTVGVDIRKYLWSRKTPESVSSDVAALLEFYSRTWGKSEFIIMGYSQGAEVVPFVFNRLPEEMKQKTKSIIMLSPEETTDFEVHISNMLGLGNKQNTLDVISEISKIKNKRQICIFGENEKTKVPLLIKNSNIEFVYVPGDHHFKGNASLIVEKIREKAGL